MIPVFPVHAALVSRIDRSHAIARIDAVPGALPAGVRAVRISGFDRIPAGVEFDALAVRAGNAVRLEDPRVAERFAAGTPNALITHVFAVGDRLPNATLIDQRGQPFRFADLAGKTTLLSFVFTRCPDRAICPAISGKFLYIERHVDPRLFHLVLVTIDPSFDSPAVLARYGATFAAEPARWSLVTGRAADVKDLMDSFGVTSIANDFGAFVHNDELAVIAPDGRIASLIPTAGWDPNDAIAVARNAAGLDSSPLRRFELASVAGIVALCGGSAGTGLVLLDSAVFILGVALLGSLLVWWGRRIFAEN